uniref:(northern house mosquito) hypothetical protein n=1 Tax=Culex pipiens TaxID=7175 RepID=A0A8D8AE85_CULPI
MGILICLSSHDPGLLGEFISTGVTISWTVAHALLHCDYLLGFVLPCKFDLGHCRHVVRRTPEEGRRGRGRRGRSASGSGRSGRSETGQTRGPRSGGGGRGRRNRCD